MTVAYKFTQAQFADNILKRGAFKLSLLSYFREFEREGSLIPDPLEGAVEGHVDYLEQHDLNTDNPADKAELDKYGLIRIAGGTTSIQKLTMKNITYVDTTEDAFILSLCTNAENTALLADGNDAIIQLVNVRTIAECLRRAHPKHLGEWHVQRVTYLPRTYDYVKHRLQPSPFIKEPRFSTQQEVRIAWRALTMDTPSFIADCPEIVTRLNRVEHLKLLAPGTNFK